MSQSPAPANPSCAAPCCGAPLRSTIGLVVRVALGAIFIFSGLMKLGIFDLSVINSDWKTMVPRDFGAAVKAFRLGLSPDMMSLLSYTIPWAEFIVGCCLVLGAMARSAALIIAVMMVGFIAGIISLLARGIDTECPCFGSMKFMCTGPLGTCHIVRNLIFLAMALTVIATGPGPLALFDPLRRKA